MTEQSTDTRFRRPELERETPVRSWGGFFQPNASQGTPGSIEQQVSTGYQVVNDYIETAAKAAEAFSEAPYNLFGNASNLGADAFRSIAPELMGQWSQLGVQFAGFATQAMQAWMQMINLSATNMAMPVTRHNPAGQRTQPAAAGPTQQTPPPTTQVITLDVRCSLPTRVNLELHPGAEQDVLAVQPLRAMDPTAPEIEKIGFDANQNGLVLVVDVPSSQPHGLYAGVVVAADSGQVRGTINLWVGEG